MIHQYNVQRQQLKILPQQIQLLNLFHLNTLELSQKIKQELEENPCLEESSEEMDNSDESPVNSLADDFKDWDEYFQDDLADAKNVYSNYLNQEIYSERPFIQKDSFRQILKEQCSLMLSSEQDLEMADYIIDSMEENGFLTEDLDLLAENFSFKYNRWVSDKEIESVLLFIQGLEPAGIGARNVCECLVLQLKRMGDRPEVKKAIDLLENYYADLKNRNMPRIREALQLDEAGLKNILTLIGSLNMHPDIHATGEFSNSNYIIPDFILTVEGDSVNVSLYRSNANALSINYGWLDSINNKAGNKQTDRATQQYIKSKISAAKWFVAAIQQREGSMLKIMKAIVQWQTEYFKEGNIALMKPMILKDIAQVVEMDISSVSRITSNKYVSTPFGLILLKDLFNEGIATEEGGIVSSYVIKNALEEIIEAEDKRSPFTDQQLVKKLSQRGYIIARRTVAKYRELLRIPTAQMRGLMGVK